MSKRLVPILCIAVFVGGAVVPAQASEVVKLARLVLTGKRLNAAEARKPAAEGRAANSGQAANQVASGGLRRTPAG